MDIRNQKQSIWRKDISMFEKTTLHVPEKAVWREISSWKTSFPTSVSGQLDLNHSIAELWQKTSVTFSSLHFTNIEEQPDGEKFLKNSQLIVFWSLRTLRKNLRINGRKNLVVLTKLHFTSPGANFEVQLPLERKFWFSKVSDFAKKNFRFSANSHWHNFRNYNVKARKSGLKKKLLGKKSLCFSTFERNLYVFWTIFF